MLVQTVIRASLAVVQGSLYSGLRGARRAELSRASAGTLMSSRAGLTPAQRLGMMAETPSPRDIAGNPPLCSQKCPQPRSSSRAGLDLSA
jgi:hypothetical protein